MGVTNTGTDYHSYWVVMQDYGKRGWEAVVDPELTRRDILARIVSGEYRNIVFVHFAHDGVVEDLTSEILEEAEPLILQAAE